MIRILTDSAADLTARDTADIPGLTIVPLNVLFEDGTTIRDGVDMTRADSMTAWQGQTSCPAPASPAPSALSGSLRRPRRRGMRWW